LVHRRPILVLDGERCVPDSGSESKKLWDWLTLLLLPLSVAAATIQFNREHPQASETPK
jgi:hypothetical protein